MPEVIFDHCKAGLGEPTGSILNSSPLSSLHQPARAPRFPKWSSATARLQYQSQERRAAYHRGKPLTAKATSLTAVGDYCFSATIACSQLPVAHWHESLGDATIADAVLDRILHNARRIALEGESLRRGSDGSRTRRPSQSNRS